MYTEDEKEQRRSYWLNQLRKTMFEYELKEILDVCFQFGNFWEIAPQFIQEKEQQLIDELIALLNCRFYAKEDDMEIQVDVVIEYTLELENMTKRALIAKLKKKQFNPNTIGKFIDKINDSLEVVHPKKKVTQPTLL